MASLSSPRENNNWIGETAAIESAKSGVIAYSLVNDPAVRRALEDGYSETPLLVERLDRQDSAYYLVPWTVEEGVAFVARVDALDGAFLSATILPEPTPSYYLTPDQALNLIGREFSHFETGTPRLVWQACRQSTDPMLPFYQVPVDSGFSYVSMDGSVFATPTSLGFGG